MSPSMLLSQLLPDVALAGHDPVLTGLVLDSRAVRPGNAFVAIAGFGAHGLGFVEQARAAGASAILFEPCAPADLPAPADAIAVPGLRAHGRDGRPVPWRAIAGDGDGRRDRHQRQDLHRAAAGPGLASARNASGSIGTLGAGLYGAVEPTGFTTPLVLQMHALLAQLRRRCARGGDGSQLACAGPGPRGRRALRRGGVHQPHPRPSGLPR